MDNSVLWAVAIGTGVLGLLLLVVAGAVAVYWNAVMRRPRRRASDRSPSHAGDIAAAGKRSPASSSTAQTVTMTIKGPWLWIKAALFALFHAGTVSVVLGGITFFEDLAKSSEEIQSTGAVTFPKQLLPGPLSGPTARRRLSRPSADSKVEDNAAAGEPGQPGTASADGAGWEVVDLVNEMGTGRR